MTKPAEVNSGTDMTCIRKEMIELPRALDGDALSDRARRLKINEEEEGRLVEAFKKIQIAHKGKLAELATDNAQLLDELRLQEEFVKVECDIMADWETKTATPYRCDDGEAVAELRRNLTGDEIQQQRQTEVPGTETDDQDLPFQLGDQVCVMCGEEERRGEVVTITHDSGEAEVKLAKKQPRRGRNKIVRVPVGEVKLVVEEDAEPETTFESDEPQDEGDNGVGSNLTTLYGEGSGDSGDGLD